MFRQGCNGLASGQPAVGVDVTPPLPPPGQGWEMEHSIGKLVLLLEDPLLCDTVVAVGVGACTGIGTAGETGAAAGIASTAREPR